MESEVQAQPASNTIEADSRRGQGSTAGTFVRQVQHEQLGPDL